MSLLRPLRTLVVDDEEIARRSLISMLAEDKEIQVVGQCSNGREAVEKVRSLGPDLLFLDIQMPGLTGIEVVRELDGRDVPWIVFVTAYDEFAVSAFEAQAVDYLLKPVVPDRLRISIQRAKEAFHNEVAQKMAKRVLEYLAGSKQAGLGAASGADLPRSESHLITIPRGSGILRLPEEDVRWVESDDQYSILHCENAEYRVRRSMGDLERELGSRGFFRLHRSYLAPLKDVVRLDVNQTGTTGEVVLRCGQRLPVSRSRLSSLRSRLRE